MNRFSVREHSSSILVAGLGSAFGVTLLLVTGDLATLISHSQAGDHASVHAILSFIALVFVAIALYTASVVTANTFATIIAGRTRTIALLRLIGASAARPARCRRTEGLLVGLVGAGLGLLVGIGANALLLAISMATGFVPSFAFGYFDPLVLLPVAAVVLTTWLASWASSRRVLVVSPMQAIGAAEERTTAEAAGRPGRTAFAIVLFVVGTLVLLGGVAIGQSSSQGLLVAVLGGMISFTGVVLAAGLIIPPALRLVGRAFGGSAPARLAAQNAVRYPERSARTTVGIVIGVTLITMFSVATQTFLDFADAARRVDPRSSRASTSC
ncbi:MAG: FtsX-like permease family protein [Galbitalea sp.]